MFLVNSQQRQCKCIEKDILNCEDGMVTFRYLHAKTGQYRTRTIRGERFLYLLMLHVLPKGFRRVRCYGFLHPYSKKLIRFLQLLLRLNPLTIFGTPQTKRTPITCPVCGMEMKIMGPGYSNHHLSGWPSIVPEKGGAYGYVTLKQHL